MSRAAIIGLACSAGVLLMLAVFANAAFRHRDVRSRERAEREGAYGPVGRRRARARARGN